MQTSTGCDSIITISLTVNNSAATSLNETVCDNYLSPGGNTYTVSGTYQDTLQTAAGCDSVITINLTVNNSNLHGGLVVWAPPAYNLRDGARNTVTVTSSMPTIRVAKLPWAAPVPCVAVEVAPAID